MSSARRQCLAAADLLTLQIGATVSYLREVLGQSKAKSAELAGVSASHMTELMSKAERAGTHIEDPLSRIPFLKSGALTDFLAEHGGLARVIASSAAAQDTLFMSRLDPAQLSRDGWLASGDVLIQAADQQWAALDNVRVGYNGTRPDNTIRALVGVGIDPELAASIAHNRVSDVRFGADLSLAAPPRGDDLPHLALGSPRRVGP